jgi:dTDP-4-amino-4,6-dideoxygalactose transaminase
MEDCAHACGVRINGRQVGTFGDVGVFSFAEGKNMPCFGGGAIATADDAIAKRAEDILSRASLPTTAAAVQTALSIWSKWLLTRPAVFGLTAYPVLRFKLARGQALMDSDVGNDLLDAFSQTPPRVSRMCNLQARLGLLQLNHIDAFNEGARRNAQLLTDALGEVPGVSVPRPTDGHHIYVYYPLTVAPERRDDLRHHLLRQGVDAKTTDMSDCTTLTAFRQADAAEPGCQRPTADAMLELCVYPEISPASIRRMARGIRTWAGLPAASHPDYRHDAKEKRAS